MAQKKGGVVGRRSARLDASGFTAILERIEEQNRATIEAVFSMKRELTEEIRALEKRLTVRIEALEFAVRKNSDDIKKNSEDIAELVRRVDELAAAMRRKPDVDELMALERRVARLESHLGIQA